VIVLNKHLNSEVFKPTVVVCNIICMQQDNFRNHWHQKLIFGMLILWYVFGKYRSTLYISRSPGQGQGHMSRNAHAGGLSLIKKQFCVVTVFDRRVTLRYTRPATSDKLKWFVFYLSAPLQLTHRQRFVWLHSCHVLYSTKLWIILGITLSKLFA